MSDPTSQPSPSLPHSDIVSICDRFEAELSAGKRPKIEDFLGNMVESERTALRSRIAGDRRDEPGEDGKTARCRRIGYLGVNPRYAGAAAGCGKRYTGTSCHNR